MHGHAERAHQGIGTVAIEVRTAGQGEAQCHERLGGILEHYTAALPEGEPLRADLSRAVGDVPVGRTGCPTVVGRGRNPRA